MHAQIFHRGQPHGKLLRSVPDLSRGVLKEFPVRDIAFNRLENSDVGFSIFHARNFDTHSSNRVFFFRINARSAAVPDQKQLH